MKTYIIAEIGPNHNGSVELAKEYIKKLSQIDVDAVKFQITIPENAYSLDAFKAKYQINKSNSDNPIEMSKSYHLSFDAHKEIYNCCKENKIDYLCSAFEFESLKFIAENFDLKYFKIPSGEIFSCDMIDYISSFKKPIILSTGMASFSEIETALSLFNKQGPKEIILLYCVSNYPAEPKDIDLNVMLKLKDKFRLKIGLSDHTLGNECAIAAVTLGATIIEKHVTINTNMSGPDHKASATIEEFAALVKSIRKIESMLGNGEKIISPQEEEVKQAVRKSIVSKNTIKKGSVIKKEDICFKRPGTGFLPFEQDKVIGKKTTQEIQKDRVIKRNQIL